MKTLSALVVVIGCLGADALGREIELPIDRHLPEIGSDWVRRNVDGVKGNYSWAEFDHKTSGDVLSFVAWKVNPSTTVSSSPVGQASIETFLSDGSARRPGVSNLGQPISEILRHRIKSVRLRSPDTDRNINVLEYTYVYNGVKDTPSTISHGYCVVLENTALFVQHTSTNAIASEVVFDVLVGILSKHFQLTGTPHSIYKGKVRKSNDD